MEGKTEDKLAQSDQNKKNKKNKKNATTRQVKKKGNYLPFFSSASSSALLTHRDSIWRKEANTGNKR